MFFCKPRNPFYSNSVHPATWRTYWRYKNNISWIAFFRCPIWLWFHHALWHWDLFIGSPNHGSPGLFVWSEVNTMISRSKLTIANRWVGAAFDGRHGSSIASPWDWELLKRIAARLCPAATSTNSRRPTSGGNQRRPRKQGRGKRHSIEWNISLQQL